MYDKGDKRVNMEHLKRDTLHWIKRPRIANEDTQPFSDDDHNDIKSSSDLSDIEGEALQLNSDIMSSLEKNDCESVSTQSEEEEDLEEDLLSSPKVSISLRQSVNLQDIEHTKQEAIEEVKHDGKKLLRDAETTFELNNEFISRSRIEENAIDTEAQSLKRMQLEETYVDRYGLPTVLDSVQLLEKIQPLLLIVKDMYKGSVHSYYKYHAANISKASHNGILTLKEFRSLDINKFLAGYYGLKRQLVVGEEILRHFKHFLLKRQGKTMRWWGVNDFANYVLAPEVLASLCIIEMNLGKNLYDKETRETAYELFDRTIEYGLRVADMAPLEPWETLEKTVKY